MIKLTEKSKEKCKVLNICLRLLLIVLFFSTSLDLYADEKQVPPGFSNSFRVVSYNVQFLPRIARHTNKRGLPIYRARQIAEKMTAFDIVALNETFDDEPRKIIHDHFRKKWKKDCHIVFGPNPKDGRFNGGLSLISRFRFIETHSMVYKNYSSPLRYGLKADGFAAKGVLHVQIELPGKQTNPTRKLDIFVTHLEARDGSIRRKQFDELAEFLTSHTEANTHFLLLGDLNTRGNASHRKNPDSKYHQLFNVLARAVPEHRLVDTWPTLYPGKDGGTKYQTKPTGGPRIDYIIIGQSKQSKNEIRTDSIRVNRYLDKKVEALSDHSAVEATLKW